jgi:transposase-like protein
LCKENKFLRGGGWIGEAERKHYWMQIFDEIKARGVEDVLFISMDGVSGLEQGARSMGLPA